MLKSVNFFNPIILVVALRNKYNCDLETTNYTFCSTTETNAIFFNQLLPQRVLLKIKQLSYKCCAYLHSLPCPSVAGLRHSKSTTGNHPFGSALTNYSTWEKKNKNNKNASQKISTIRQIKAYNVTLCFFFYCYFDDIDFSWYKRATLNVIENQTNVMNTVLSFNKDNARGSNNNLHDSTSFHELVPLCNVGRHLPLPWVHCCWSNSSM